jgi:hypothetical protein
MGTALRIETSICDTVVLSTYLAPLSLFKPNPTTQRNWFFFVTFNEGIRILGMGIHKTAVFDSVYGSTIRNG